MQIGNSAESMRETANFAFRVSVFYGALFVVAGVKLPYFPVWLDGRGLSTAEIAVITAAPLFVRILATPALGIAADASGDRRKAIVILAWGAAAGFCLLAVPRSFWPILLISLTLSVATTSIMPLTETVAMSGVRQYGLDYGRMRLWGSLTFIAASFAAGLAVERAGFEVVLWLMIAGAWATVASAHSLPAPAAAGGAEAVAAAKPRPSIADAVKLALSARFGLFIAAVGTAQASHAVFYTFGVLHWREQGIASGWAGVLWAIGVIAEIGLFAWSRAIVQRTGALALVLTGASAGAVRWCIMAADPPLALLLPLQALHGLTYGASHLGSVHYMSEHVPAEQAGTAQALYAAVTSGVAMGIATVAAGPLYASFKGGAYLAMGLMSAVGLAAGLALARIDARDAAARKSLSANENRS